MDPRSLIGQCRCWQRICGRCYKGFFTSCVGWMRETTWWARKKRIASFAILCTVDILWSCQITFLRHRWTITIVNLRLAGNRDFFNFSAQYKKGNGVSHIYLFGSFMTLNLNPLKLSFKLPKKFRKNVSESRIINTFPSCLIEQSCR